MDNFIYTPGSPIDLGRCSDGRNIHIPLTDADSGSEWFGKLCCPIGDDPYFYQREIIFSTLAKKAGAPALPAKPITSVVNATQLINDLRDFGANDDSLRGIDWATDSGGQTNWADYLTKIEALPPIVATPWVKHQRLRDLVAQGRDLRELSNLRALVGGCLVNIWLGAGDGNSDLNVIINDLGEAFLIDYGYAGPCIDDPKRNVNNTCAEVSPSNLKRFIPIALQPLVVEQNGVIEETADAVQRVSERDIRESFEVAQVLGTLPEEKAHVLCEELLRRRPLLGGIVRALIPGAT